MTNRGDITQIHGGNTETERDDGMLVGLHDAEMEHFGKGTNKFPNYALMKISAYHKARGDEVEWWEPIRNPLYDVVYSSKVFDFTPENPYLPDCTIRGGTGYGLYDELPQEIDDMFPDYSIYPECDYAIGFLTRGCIRNCRWCVVPKKEGKIRPYRTWRDVVRRDTDKLTLMDNNILACDYGIRQLRELSETDYRIDLNQGMDARLVDEDIADILARINWIKHIRFSCDKTSQIAHVQRVVRWLTERGVKESYIFVYMLITSDISDDLKRIYSLRECGNIMIYGQAEKNPTQGIMPEHWQNVMAQKYLYQGSWRKVDWADYIKERPFLNVKIQEG